MALDVPAVPIASQTLRYAKAAWDYVRDGGGPGLVPTASQQLPARAFILGAAVEWVDPISDVGTSTMQLCLGANAIGSTFNPASDGPFLQWGADIVGLGPDTSLPICLTITGDGYSAGSMLLYVFYV